MGVGLPCLIGHLGAISAYVLAPLACFNPASTRPGIFNRLPFAVRDGNVPLSAHHVATGTIRDPHSRDGVEYGLVQC